MKRNIFVFSCFAHSWRKKTDIRIHQRRQRWISPSLFSYLHRSLYESLFVCVCLSRVLKHASFVANVTILFNWFYKACFAFCTFLKSSDISGVDAKVHSMWSCSFCRTWSDLRVHTEGWGNMQGTNMQLMNLFYGNRLVFYALSFQCGPDTFVPQEIFIHFMFLWQFAATLVLSLDFHL